MKYPCLCSDHFPALFQIALDLFRRPSPSGHEHLVRAYVVEHLVRYGFIVSLDPTGNVLATRGVPDPGEGYPLLSFHMDCVSYTTKVALRPLSALEMTNGWLHSKGEFVLGGDDKCGGAIALTLAALTTAPMKMVASVQEEVGCVGIKQIDPRFFEDVIYALVLDRRGANHLIVSIAGHLLCQGVFAAVLMRAAATTGLLVYAAEGALSDALTLSCFIPNVVNMSVGYYRPHTLDEQVSLADLWHSYQWVREALSSLPRCQHDLNLPFPRQAQEEGLLCPDCQHLTIAPSNLPADLWRFLCHCAEGASASLPEHGTQKISPQLPSASQSLERH